MNATSFTLGACFGLALLPLAAATPPPFEPVPLLPPTLSLRESIDDGSLATRPLDPEPTPEQPRFNPRLPGPGPMSRRAPGQMPIIEPDPSVHYTMLVKRPDPDVDYKMLVPPLPGRPGRTR